MYTYINSTCTRILLVHVHVHVYSTLSQQKLKDKMNIEMYEFIIHEKSFQIETKGELKITLKGHPLISEKLP